MYLYYKLDCTSIQKVRKFRYQSILVLSNFTGFFYFVSNILPGIVGIAKTRQDFNLPEKVL